MVNQRHLQGGGHFKIFSFWRYFIVERTKERKKERELEKSGKYFPFQYRTVTKIKWPPCWLFRDMTVFMSWILSIDWGECRGVFSVSVVFRSLSIKIICQLGINESVMNSLDQGSTPWVIFHSIGNQLDTIVAFLPDLFRGLCPGFGYLSKLYTQPFLLVDIF